MAELQIAGTSTLPRHLRARTAAVMSWIEEQVPKPTAAIDPLTTDAVIESLQAQGVTDAVIAASLSQLRRRGYTFSTSVLSTKIGFVPNETLKSRGDRSQSPETQLFSDDEEFRTIRKVIAARQLEDKYLRAQRDRDQEEMVDALLQFQELLSDLLQQFQGKPRPGQRVASRARHAITSISEELLRSAPHLGKLAPPLCLIPLDRIQLRGRLSAAGRAQMRYFC